MSNRKAYIIVIMQGGHASDVAWRGTLHSYNDLSDKGIEMVQGSELIRQIGGDSPKYLNRDSGYGIILRRARARKILAAIKADTSTWGRGTDFKLVEVGEFNRTTRPVKHWNIMRQHRSVDATGSKVKPLGPWSEARNWVTGFSLREEARASAKIYTNDYAHCAVTTGEQFKFTVVPVYADKE